MVVYDINDIYHIHNAYYHFFLYQFFQRKINQVIEYRKKLYNDESDYYNSEGKKYFARKDYDKALSFYNNPSKCLSDYKVVLLEKILSKI